MNTLKSLALTAICTSLFAGQALAQSDQPVTWNSYWNNGFNIKSSDGNYKLKFGGRVMLDFTFLDAGGALNSQYDFTQGVQFRRLRLFNSGQIYKNVKYKLDVDMTAGKITLKDAFLQLTNLPVVGNLMVGHFKESIGLEFMTSSKYITFIERGLNMTFIPERNTGIVFFNSAMKDRMTWSIAYLYPIDENGDGQFDGRFHVTGRVTGVPLYQDEGGYKLLHLGMSVSH